MPGETVVLTGRDPDNIAGGRRGDRRPGDAASRFDLAGPETIAPALADVGPVRRLALVAIDRDQNTVADYDIGQGDPAGDAQARRLHGGRPRPLPTPGRRSSIVLFGGMAKERPYPGSTTVTTVNGGVVGPDPDARRGAQADPLELDPPGRRRRQPVLGGQDAGDRELHAETPTGRLATMAEIVGAAVFLLENTAVNGVDLIVDGGWHCR